MKCTIKQGKEDIMGDWRTQKVTDQYREIVNIKTGSIRRIPFASDKQWNYLEMLREKHAKDPSKYSRLKNRPTIHQAKKQIDKLLEKDKQQGLL